MRIKQNLLLFTAFLVVTACVLVTGSETASAAFHDKAADCRSANGVWWEGRCWLLRADGKQKCLAADGDWHEVPIETAPYAVGLALADPMGYCEVDDSPDDPPSPHECTGNVDALTGECAEYKYCKKYTNTAVRNACIKGYTKGKAACNRFSGDQKDACNDGAENGVHKHDDPSGNAGCGSIETSIITCSGRGGNPIVNLFLDIVNFLAIGVGIVVVGGIVWGGITIVRSNGNSSVMHQGIVIIVNAVVGLLLFIFMYAIINFLVPGGLFT